MWRKDKDRAEREVLYESRRRRWIRVGERSFGGMIGRNRGRSRSVFDIMMMCHDFFVGSFCEIHCVSSCKIT